ncbi:MAG: reverse transcriptase [Deltaproteobacteria bacterium]|nr:reverse transcriptase [Deltaproteobacteria bacterium]
MEFDIKGMFDNIDHELLLRAVRKHTEWKWVILYIERWLKAPLQLAECGLQMHPDKTGIVYCKDSNRRGKYPNTKFDFLEYTFRPRSAKNLRQDKLFVSFAPAVSSKALTAMRQTARQWNIRNRADLGLTQISRMFNPVLRGWLNYYGRFHPSAMNPVLRHFDLTLIAWAMRKYKKLKGRKTRAGNFLAAVAKREPHLLIW